MSDRLAKPIALLLICLAPLVFGARALLEKTTEAAQLPPTFAHLLVITCGEFQGTPDLLLPHMSALEKRSTRPLHCFAPSDSVAGSAASLWTGRWPASHGLVADQQSLAANTWSLAESARVHGAKTAAFSNQATAHAQGLLGFEQQLADESWDARQLGQQAATFLNDCGQQRFVLWLHLKESGPRGSALDELLGLLQTELEQQAFVNDTLSLVTAFSYADLDRKVSEEAAFRVPLWVRFPAGILSGRRARAALNLVDLCEILLPVLKLPGPDTDAGQTPIQARDQVDLALRGGAFRNWQLLQTQEQYWLLLEIARLRGRGLAQELKPGQLDQLEILQRSPSGPTEAELRQMAAEHLKQASKR